MPMQYVEGPDDLYHQPFYWSHTPGDKNLTGFGKVRLYNAAEATDCVINFRGNDYFTDTHADRCIVNGSKKVNLIMNFGDNSKVFGNGGNDTLMNSNANHCTIIGGKDNDVIHQKDGSAYVYIDAGDGANTILNWNTSNTTIKSGKNNDFISNFQNASNVVIDSGSGNDNIQIHGGNYFTVNGGKGNDRITNYTGNNVSIKSGSAKDTLYGDIISNGHIRSHYQYMQGSSLLESISEYVKGKGKLEWVAVSDEIAEGGSDVSITAGGGDDEIMNFGGSNVKINTGNGKNLVSLVGSVSQLSIKGGADNDTVYGGSSEVYYEKNSYSGNAQVSYNRNDRMSNAMIEVGDGENLVSLAGNGQNIYVKGGNDADFIYGYDDKKSKHTGSYFNIDAGNGNNVVTIGSSWNHASIQCGKDADFVINKANNSNIVAGASNDVITNEGNYTSIFGGADGDIITNYGSHVYISGDTSVDSVRPSSDYIYTSKGTDVTIDGGKNDDIIEAWHDVRASISGGKGNDLIYLYRVTTEDKKHIIWKGITTTAGQIFSKINKTTEAISNFWGNLNTANEIYSGLKAKDIGRVIQTGVIAGIDAISPVPIGDFLEIKSYLDELTLSSTTVIGGKGDDTIVSDGFAPRIFKYAEGDGNDVLHRFNVTKKNKDASKMSTLYITKGLISEVEIIGSDVILKIGKGSVRLVNGANHKFKLREADGTLTTRSYRKDSKGEVVCSIFGSSKSETLMDNVGIKRQTYISNPGTIHKDKIIGTINKSVMYGYGGKDVLIANDKDTTLDGGNGKDYLIGGDGNDILYGGDGNDTLYGGNGNDILYGGDDNNKLYGNEGNDTLYGGTGIGYLSGGDGNDSIIGGLGHESLIGGIDDDTLIGNGGADTFVYANGDGKDTITDYTAGEDKIKITSGSISKTTVSGKDVIFSVGNGSITVKNGKGKKITVVNSKGKTSTKTYTKNSSANTAELWFTSDNINFSTSSAQIDSITQNGLADYSLGNVNTTTDWTALTPTDALTSALTFSDK